MENTTVPEKRGRGRPEGSASRMAREAREAAQRTGLLPHEILLSIARGQIQELENIHPETGEVIKTYQVPDLETRKDAAKAAAPYFAPKISTVEVINGISDDGLDQIIARAAAEAGISLGVGGEGTQDSGTDSAAGSSKPRIRGD